MRIRMALLVAMLLSVPAYAATPVGWRGDGTGRFPAANPSATWSPTENVLWKAELPGGSPASPILVGDRLLVTSDPALLICLRAADGEILWQRQHQSADLAGTEAQQAGDAAETHNPDGNAGSAASTAVSDGQTVYAMFSNGVVAAYDLQGNRRWVRYVEKPSTGFGHATSPLLVGGMLIVQFKDLFALDARSGRTAWSETLPASHASPVAAKIDGTDVIVHPAGCLLRAEDGKRLAEGLFHLTQSSPVVQEGLLLAHENGTLKAFSLPRQAGDSLEVQKLWETPSPRSQYQIPSPVVHQGRVYGVSMSGIWQVTDAGTGQEIYRQRLPLSSRVYASVHLAGDKLFVADQTGKTVVIQPGSEYRQLAVNELDYHPTSFVFGGKRMYVRTWRGIYCVGE